MFDPCLIDTGVAQVVYQLVFILLIQSVRNSLVPALSIKEASSDAWAKISGVSANGSKRTFKIACCNVRFHLKAD